MSQWPTDPDDLLLRNIAGDVQIKQAVDALQIKLQRLFTAQANAFPLANGHVTVDMSQGSQLAIIMPNVGNIFIDNPINAQDGDWLTIFLLQGTIGGNLVTWGSAFRKGTLTLSLTASTLDAVTFRFSAGAGKWNQIAAPVLGIS